MVIFLYSDLLYRVLVSHNNKQYMHQPLVALLRTGKERCDEFVVSILLTICILANNNFFELLKESI